MTKKLTEAQKAANKKAKAAKLKAEKEAQQAQAPDPQTPPPAPPVKEFGPAKNKQEELAALIYYEAVSDDAGGGYPSFEKLPEEEAKKYVDYAGSVLAMISKLGFTLVDQKDPRLKAEHRLRRKDHIEAVILEFMKTLNVRKAGKHKEKQKLINPAFFPAGELAFKIVDAPYDGS